MVLTKKSLPASVLRHRRALFQLLRVPQVSIALTHVRVLGCASPSELYIGSGTQAAFSGMRVVRAVLKEVWVQNREVKAAVWVLRIFGFRPPLAGQFRIRINGSVITTNSESWIESAAITRGPNRLGAASGGLRFTRTSSRDCAAGSGDTPRCRAPGEGQIQFRPERVLRSLRFAPGKDWDRSEWRPPSG